MLPYLVLVGFIAFLAMVSTGGRFNPAVTLVAFVVLWIFVGLRHHVGMDWNNYLIMIYRASRGSVWDSLDVAEPGYALLLRLAADMNWGVYGAYFIGTFFFLAGLFRYARTTPEPWMAVLTAMPILVIVIAMAAARQSIAIGVLLWLAADWRYSSLFKRITFIVLAAAFHYSALIFLIFVVLDLRIPLLLQIGGAAILALVVVLATGATGRTDYYDGMYVTGQTALTQSRGAVFHVMLNGIPAIAALAMTKSRGGPILPDRYHVTLAIFAIALIPLSLITSVAAGRMTLYLFPVSMWVCAALPKRISSSTQAQMLVRGGLAATFVLMTAVWLAFGNSASAHRNYQNALFVNDRELRWCCRRLGG